MSSLGLLVSILLALVFLVLSFAVLYLFLLALAWCVGYKKISSLPPPQKRFAILVPAHNEEKVIEQCLGSLKNLNYYPNLFKTYVVADNCTDQTPQIAKSNGVDVLERADQTHRGKGFALAWGLERINLSLYDAVIILDADCIVQGNLLLALNHRLSKGQKVLQVYDGIYNIGQSLLTYLLYLGNSVENYLFYGGREVLGLSSLLRGTGMCFSTEILQKFSWKSFSEAEDLEFSLQLIQNGSKIHFVPETKILAIQPSGMQTAYTQKRRWAGGTFQLIRSHVFRLLSKGITGFKPGLIELAFSLSLLSRPFLILLNILALLATPFLPVIHEITLIWWGVTLLSAQICYLGLSLLLAESKARALKTLYLAPFYLLWLFSIQIASLFRGRPESWQKTARENA
jgi:cellulose synthase/poly-beta-1,6-N-acetylglucosamine synthase-like glycosyltransferase